MGMKKNFKFLILSVLVLLFLGCKDEIIVDVDTSKTDLSSSSFVLTTSMPANGTRVALTPDGKNVGLTWEEGDEIQLVFVQAEKKVKQVVQVENISTDGKSATFGVNVPEDFTDGVFELYGIYGGGGLDNSNPTLALLPTNSSDGSLESIQNNEDVMLYFAQEDIEVDAPSATVVFKHLGSLFTITLQNTSISPLSLSEIRLISDAAGWAFNYGSGGGGYDLVNEEFTNVVSASGNYLSFSSPDATLSAGESIVIRGWYPPRNDVNWPELKLELRNGLSSIAISENSKPARTASTPSGKNFHFSAQWNGAELMFTPSMSFTTSREHASGIRFRIDAEPEDQEGVWIDLNNNGVMEPEEKVITFGTTIADRVTYDFSSSVVAVYGKVTYIECSSMSLTSVDVRDNYALERQDFSFNDLTEIDFTHNPNLQFVQVGGNQLQTLDLSANTNLLQVQANRNQLTSLTLPLSTDMNLLNLTRNNLSAGAISDILNSLLERTAVDAGKIQILDSNHINPKGNGDELNQVIESHSGLAAAKNWILEDLNPPPLVPIGPSMTFTTSRTAANIRIRVNAEPEDQADVWIDLNNNGVMDSGEKVNTFGTTTNDRVNYSGYSSTFTIYGKVNNLEINNQSITSAEVNDNPWMISLNLPFNNITEINVSELTNLAYLQLGVNQLSELDLTNNINLLQIQLNRNQLTSLVLPIELSSSNDFNQLNIVVNKFTESQITDIVNLLPDRNGLDRGRLYLSDNRQASDAEPEGNVTIPAHTNSALSKNWHVWVDNIEIKP